MEPIIYKLPKPDKPIAPDAKNIYFDAYPSPKLIKYGFNSMSEQLDLVELTKVPYYKAGLHFDFSRKGKDTIADSGNKSFAIKDFDQTFAEFWEIITMFDLFKKDTSVLTSHEDTVRDIIKAYTTLNKSKNKLDLVKGKAKADLVFHKLSDTDIDENAAIQLITMDLPKLLSSQSPGSNMVLQIFSTQTQIMAEIIYYLASNYEEAYLVKPSIISEIFDEKYLVLINLIADPKFNLPKHRSNDFLSSLGLEPPTDFETSIQCMNAELLPAKFKKYYEIKAYLDTKVYEGATYQEMLADQDDDTDKWIATFTDLSKPPAILDARLKKSDTKCKRRSDLINSL